MPTKRPGVRALADLMTPMSIRVAATLRIADHIEAGRTDIDALAPACSADAAALDRLMRHLCTVGVLARDDLGRYRLTDTGHELRSDHPGGRRPWLDIHGGVGRGDLCFVDLLHTVQTGEPAYPVRYGSGFWEDLERNDELSASFDELMNHHVSLDNTHQGVAESFPWQTVSWMVDVGGGSGALALHLVRQFPGLRATVLDRAGPAGRAETQIAAAGLGDRTDVVVGDFFDPLPRRADVYVLSAILHDWDDLRATKILRRCRQALGPDGAVLVVEAVGTGGEQVGTGMDMRMLAYSGGRERGVAGLAALGSAAGLQVVGTRQIPQARYMSVLELRPASTHTR